MCFTRRPESGHPQQTSYREVHHIVRNARVQPTISWAAIQAQVTPSLAPVSSRTIRRWLAEGHLGPWRPLRVLPLTHTHRCLRLEWCHARGNWTAAEWNQVVFSDESRFNLSSDDNRVRVWRNHGERLNPAFALHRHTSPTAGVMVWGVIAYSTRSSLVLIRGTMTAQRYVHDILQPHMLPRMQRLPGTLFQQDNARPHIARVSQVWLHTVLPFLGLPDPQICLQPSISGILWKGDLNELEARLQQISNEMSEDIIHNLYASMPDRISSCNRSRGGFNRRVILPCGRTLGGGSTVNALVMSRGNRKNYDEWAKLGAQGWSYDDVFQYFIKLEDNRDPVFAMNGWHGIGGPISVERQNYQPKVKTAIVDSASELGYKFVDVNGPTQHGSFSMVVVDTVILEFYPVRGRSFYDFQATLRKGQRCSTAKGYLVPSENRTNLHILSRAMVTKILFEKKQAVGVEFDFRGKRHHVAARKEVIVSAGAINTAKLLMISGIGPMNELERLRIPVVADLPVGRNLQEHPAGFIAFELDESVQLLHKRLFDEENISKYIKDRSDLVHSPEAGMVVRHHMGGKPIPASPLAYSSGISLIAFLSNNSSGEAKDITDHELYFLELPALVAKLRVGFTPKAYQQVFGPYEKKPILVCLSQILHPKSRGFVRLRTNSPYDFPDINPNYLDDPQDLKDIVEGLKTCIKILQAPPMSKVGARMFNTSFPGCEGSLDDLEVFLKCITRAAVMSLSHPVGTAKMGDPHDPSSVVDPELR
ncbi:glucose dehydrogenase [Trichonephila clavipes]|nr:glucose dehydrogenase [Trichonephila clavipes]